MLYSNQICYFDILNKYNLPVSQRIYSLGKLNLAFSIRDIEDDFSHLFAKSNIILEFMGLKKSIFSLKKKYLKGKGRRQYSFTSKISLRKKNLWNFIYFFSILVLPEFSERYLRLIVRTSKKKNYIFFLTLKDISVFPMLGEIFIKWPYPIAFSFLLNKFSFSKTLVSELIFRNFVLNQKL